MSLLNISFYRLDNFSKETTPLNQIFGGYIRTEGKYLFLFIKLKQEKDLLYMKFEEFFLGVCVLVTCLECNHVSTTFQHFQDLILDIRQASTSTVYDALENYFSKERLDGDESYHCERCKKKVSAYKKFSVERAPNALCIQLKR